MRATLLFAAIQCGDARRVVERDLRATSLRQSATSAMVLHAEATVASVGGLWLQGVVVCSLLVGQRQCLSWAATC